MNATPKQRLEYTRGRIDAAREEAHQRTLDALAAIKRAVEDAEEKVRANCICPYEVGAIGSQLENLRAEQRRVERAGEDARLLLSVFGEDAS